MQLDFVATQITKDQRKTSLIQSLAIVSVIEVRAQKSLGAFSLDAELKDAGMICLLGNNGSGKTSLLNAIAGILAIDAGYVRINSSDITGAPQEKRDVVLVTPDSAIPNFEVDRHLEFGARLRKLSIDHDLIESVKNKLGINFSGRVSKLSLGMKERVALATALLARPSAILVDEAFSNIDNKLEFIENFRELTSRFGIDVAYSTQHPEDSKIADHVYMIEGGKTTRER